MYKEAIIEISGNCNLNCVMCGYGARYNTPQRFMEYDLYTDILDQLNGNYEVLRLNGRGESTIHPKFVSFLNYAKSNYPEKRIRLFSNMNYKSRDITRALADCSCETMISLDSVDKESLEKIRLGCHYETIIKNIEDLCSMTPLTAIVYTMQPANFYEAYDVAKFAMEHNCHFFCNAVRNYDMEKDFHLLVEKERTYLLDLYKELKEMYSAANGLMLHLPQQISGVTLDTDIGAMTCSDYGSCPNIGKDICICYDGTVIPCGMFNPCEIGNVKDTPISEIMSSDALEEFVKQQPNNEYCRNCQYMCK